MAVSVTKTKDSQRSLAAAISSSQSSLADLITRHLAHDGAQATAIPRLNLLRASQLTVPLPVVYEPAVCLVAQGHKQVILAKQSYIYGPEQYLVTSVDLPVIGQVIDATPTKPYLCVRLDLDPAQLSALLMETEPTSASSPTTGTLELGLAVVPIEQLLLDATLRLLRLLDTPRDIPILAPLIEREILYRLLSGPYGARLRQIALADARLLSVNRAIHWLKHNYAEPFRMETLAREARLSASALHHYFKSVTALSPLQYQKRLRLQEARRLMLGQALDTATASQSVGYESPSQFSREYSRLFGAPPARDIARLKEAAGATAES